MARHRNAGGGFIVLEPGMAITGSVGILGESGHTHGGNPPKTLTVQYDSSDTAAATGHGLAGGTQGFGVLIENTNTTANSYASLDFRAATGDGRIALQYKNANDADFHFITDNNDSPQVSMTITSDGKVGIGTTSPNNSLSLEKTDGYRGIGFVRKDTSITDGNILGLINFGGSTDGGSTYDYNSAAIAAVAEGTWDTTDTDSGARLEFYLTPDGSDQNQVSHRFHADGRLRLRQEASTPSAPSDGQGGYLYVKADGKPYWRSFEVGETDLTSTATLAGFTDGGSTVSLTTSTDKVAIGTVSDIYKLNVGIVDSENIGGVYIDFEETGNHNALHIDSEAAYPAIAVKGKQGMRIEQDLSSGYGLLIDRNIAEAGSAPLVSFIDDHTSNTQTTLRVQQDGTGDILNLFDGATEVFTVVDGGKVGIGTSSPTNKLVVEVADSENIGGVYIDFNETGNYNALYVDSEAAYPAITVKGKQGMRIEQDISSGYGLLVDRNIAEAGSNPLVSFVDDNTNNTSTTLKVQHDGAGVALDVNSGASHYAARFYGGGLYISQDIASQRGIYCIRAMAEAGSHPLCYLFDNNTANEQPTLKVVQRGTTADAVFVGNGPLVEDKIFGVSSAGNVTAPDNCIVIAWLTTNQTISANSTWDTIVFDGESVDTQSAYNNTTGVFTAPIDGYYHIEYHLWLTNVQNDAAYYYIKIDTTENDQAHIMDFDPWSIVPYVTVESTFTVWLDANDTFRIYWYQSAGTANTTAIRGHSTESSYYNSKLSIRLIQ